MAKILSSNLDGFDHFWLYTHKTSTQGIYPQQTGIRRPEETSINRASGHRGIKEPKAKDEANVEDTAYPVKEDELDSLSFMAWAKAALMTFSEDMLIRRTFAVLRSSREAGELSWVDFTMIVSLKFSTMPSLLVQRPGLGVGLNGQ
nr:proteasome subunit alpha type-1 [Tanacetum cinerariifolium]